MLLSWIERDNVCLLQIARVIRQNLKTCSKALENSRQEANTTLNSNLMHNPYKQQPRTIPEKKNGTYKDGLDYEA